MTAGMSALLLVFLVSALLRLPVVTSMFASAIAYLLVSRQDLGLLADQTMNSMLSLSLLLAVPLFILTANVMNAVTISDRLWAAGSALVGRLRGGHGHVTVLMNIVMSSMTGSAVSDVAGAGIVAVRMMRTQGGYPGGLACAIAASASLLGPLIPPSIPMVLYALLSGASIGALFLAGLLPGLLVAVSISAWIFFIAGRRDLPRGEAVPLAAWPGVVGKAAVPMTLPAVLLGGIWFGVFTTTEAAAVAAGWAILLGVAWYRNLSGSTLLTVFRESTRQSAVVMMLIMSSFVVNYAITNEGIADAMATWFTKQGFSPLAFMLVVNVLFLVLGTVLDGAVMLLVFVPILLPTVKALGIDLVYFGVIVIINFMIAIISPPYGLILFVLSALTRVPVREINREIWPFLIPLSITLALLIVFPEITLFLPRRFGY